MKYFVFVASATDPDNNWSLAQTVERMSEVKRHMNDRNLYPDPTAWQFKVIKGRELTVDFQAMVSIKK